VQTRTRNAIAGLLIAGAIGLCIFALVRSRPPGPLRSRAFEAVPAGPFLVATANLDALRATPIGPKLLAGDRDIPGLGKVRDVCGIDPMERVREIVLAVPAAGDAGDFGIVAIGDVPEDEILACASRVIEKRGGKPVVSTVGSFRTVRDGTLVVSGAEIAVKKGGPILLGAGAYLRAMIDAADGRTPTVASSVAHARLAASVQGGTVRATVALTPTQRDQLMKSLAEEGGPRGAASIVGGAIGATVGSTVAIHAVIACDDTERCAEVATLLRRARDERAADLATRIAGFARVLSAVQITAEGETIQIKSEVPADEALVLFERLLLLRGTRHPMPKEPPEPERGDPPAPSASAPSASAPAPADAGAPDAMALPAPDEVLTAKGDAGAPPRDAGARDAAR
jgi:hypothetical protein